MNKILGIRLDKLITDYIDKKNQQIKLENEKIENNNRKKQQDYKMKIRHTSGKLSLEKKLKKYTKEQLMNDINQKFHINLTRQKLSQYKNNEHMPSNEVIDAFCKFFNTTYEYLCGNSDIINPSVSRIQEFIGLNDTAINTLMGIKNPAMLTVLNALLSDSASFEYALFNMYEQTYQTYEQKHRPNSYGDYDTSIIHSNIEYAISLSKFIENRLMPFVKNDFENRLQNQMDYEEWRNNNFEEYERTKVPDDIDYDDSGKATVVVPTNKKE